MDEHGHSSKLQAPLGFDIARKTLLFANDKSSGKTTIANAVLVSLRGADFIWAIYEAPAEIPRDARTLDSVRPTADRFAGSP